MRVNAGLFTQNCTTNFMKKEKTITIQSDVVGTSAASTKEKQIKKEDVEKVLSREKNEVKKATNPNPISTGKTTPKKNGTIIAVRENSTNHNVTGIEKGSKKESTIEWVHRRFGTSKEELRELNVTTNHSCHDIPSQSCEDSEDNGVINEANSGEVLLSDEVEKMDGPTSSRNKEEKGSIQEELEDNLCPSAIVNPRAPQTRVQTSQGSTKRQEKVSLGDDQVTNKEGNKQVNPKGTVQCLASVGGDPVELSGGDQAGDDNVEVLKDTVGSKHQTTEGNRAKLNGTVIFVGSATVNPSLGDVYEL
ncbi:uncharacterized protein [Nicotiana tomentosiformis]|uniref:uncharacterized protein n=1 Tax=Nicotiana tomentosiformis TaxID=4098 RepID=UPI00388C5D3E